MRCLRFSISGDYCEEMKELKRVFSTVAVVGRMEVEIRHRLSDGPKAVGSLR